MKPVALHLPASPERLWGDSSPTRNLTRTISLWTIGLPVGIGTHSGTFVRVKHGQLHGSSSSAHSAAPRLAPGVRGRVDSDE